MNHWYSTLSCTNSELIKSCWIESVAGLELQSDPGVCGSSIIAAPLPAPKIHYASSISNH